MRFLLFLLFPLIAQAQDKGFVISHNPSRLPALADWDMAMWMPIIIVSLGFVVAAKVLLGKPVKKIEDKEN